ncbi:hypothetical protein CKO28_16740 [Rhodovibrio sodomensis]|uniref:Uncharacterized protein n=1 Tax=Rhodovibrio sodomensis TaxID=1088 RepID=A0ABS1DHC8_9PROT|nr:hypothetical protein [Rhodovibrio sodomensis]MBK1669688.1 hypothetical protein [Rhodovibrio sodomensis]
MFLGPAALADRLDRAARTLSHHDSKLAQACSEASAFFREEFDVAPGASGEAIDEQPDSSSPPSPERKR